MAAVVPDADWVMFIVQCCSLVQLLCVLPSYKFLENVQARDFLMQKLYALRRPKTNIQILQQNVLLKYKSVRIYFYGVSVVDAGVWSKLVIFLANASKTSSFVYLFKTVLCSIRYNLLDLICFMCGCNHGVPDMWLHSCVPMARRFFQRSELLMLTP